MLSSIQLTISNCINCPFCTTERTRGAGYAQDYICKKTPDTSADYGFKVIAGYVEWDSEAPQNGKIPNWCPFAPKP